MAAYETLRAAIDSYIKANGNKEITGTVLNDILNAMVSALGADTRFAGVAVPSTNPGNPEGNVVYFASQAGTYSNFGGIVLPLGIHILVWNGTAWTSQTWFSVNSTPTQNSQNLVTSGGIFQAIVDAVGVERLRAIGAEVTSCSFNSTTKKVSFFNSANSTLFQLDATAFIIDGMVSDVKIEDGNLVIKFNTDAGKQDIEIPLTEIFDPANYYTKTTIDTLLTAINNKLADGCLYRGMAEPTTNPPTPTTKVFYIATKAGTYTNFGNIAVTEGITILKYDGSNWSKEQISYSDGVFDISAYNGTSYADLSAALGTNGANIPQNLRKGGMSVKFVQSSDNKYVQYFLTKDEWSLSEADWQKMNLEEEVSQLGQEVKDSIAQLNYLLNTCKQVFENDSQTNNLVCFRAGYKYYLKYEHFEATYGDMYYKVDDESEGVKIKTFVCSGGVSDAYEFTAPVDAKYLYFTTYGIQKTVVSVVPETGLKEVLNTLSSTISTQGESITSLISSLSSASKKIDLLDYTKVLKNSINLYDIDSVERGYFLGSGGNKNYIAGWLNSRGLLKVFWGNNTKVTLNCCGASGGAYVCQFDADDNFISGTSQGGLDTSVTITKAEGAAYVYLEVFISGINSPQINFGESLGDYTLYNPIDGYLDDIRERISERVEENSSNLYQESLAEWGYWISTSGAKYYTAAWATSRGLFKVKWGNNTKLTVNCAFAQEGTYTAQFDVNGNYITDSKVDGTGTQTYTKVSGAVYIYVAINYSTPNKQIVFGESLLDPYVSYNPISGYIPGIKSSLQPVTKHLYANSNTGIDDATHFYGLSAIQNAINAVPQQSADNYVIHVKGSYYFDTPSKFYNAPDYDIYYYGFYISPTQRNITIIGEGIERTKVVCCLADNLGSTFAYDKYITAEVLGDNCKVIGMTISAQNMRYAVHLDRSGYDYCNNYHITYENCKLTHQGNTGNAATVWGATPSPFGLGISSGMTVTIKECHIEKKGGTALYCHDNRNLEEPYLLEFINCTIITKGSSLLTVANLGSNVNGVIKLIGNHNYYGGTVIAQLTNSGLNVADYGIPLTRIISDNPSKLHYLPQDSGNNGRVLKFTANTAGQSVRIYDTYSGFETLIKGKYGYNGNSFSGIVESDGYRYLDGATDYAGWAMGLKALDMGTNASIQKRLGDCSSTNIKLSVGLYGETPQEIVFDKDYTDYTDADMLDEINNQLTGITAELYWLAMDYYPETPSLLNCENDTLGVTIKKGMGVHINGGLVTKATSNDELDAIALDDIKYGCWGRVIKKAVLNTSYYDYNVVLIENDSKNYSNGAKFSIGTTPGVFVRDDTNGILRVHQYSNIIVDL